MLSLFDFQFIFTSVLIIILGFLHEIAGIQAYIQGSSLGIFRKNSDWIPETGKEITLLGVFFMITFAWWQSKLLVILLIMFGNPLSFWLGVIDFLFTLPQLLLLFKYVRWNRFAQGCLIINLISVLIWLFPFM